MKFRQKNTTKMILMTSVAVLLNSCGNLSSKGEVPQQVAQKYPVVALTKGDAAVYTDFAAEVVGKNVAELRSRAAGYIEKIYVAEGSEVKKGQVLLKINDDEYQQRVNAAISAVKVAEANVNNAKLEVTKLTPLVEKDIVSKLQLETAQSVLESAYAALSQARSNYNDSKIMLSYTTITSPVNGVIGTIGIYPGSLINPGDLITNVSSSGNVYAYFVFDEKRLLDITKNIDGKNIYDKVAKLPDVEFILADGSTYNKKGKIVMASGIVNTQTGSIQLKAEFENPDMVLRSGSTGRVRIPVNYTNMVLIPQKATFELQDKIMVYTITEDNKVASKKITIGGETNGLYVVTGGVEEGEKILYEGLNKVREGMTIDPEIKTIEIKTN